MTRRKINKLIPEQEAFLPVLRDEWLKIALDTSSIDKQKVGAALRLFYKNAGLYSPEKILWFANAFQAAK